MYTYSKWPLRREKTNLNRPKQHIRECHTYIEKFREKKDQWNSLAIHKEHRKMRKTLKFQSHSSVL